MTTVATENNLALSTTTQLSKDLAEVHQKEKKNPTSIIDNNIKVVLIFRLIHLFFRKK